MIFYPLPPPTPVLGSTFPLGLVVFRIKPYISPPCHPVPKSHFSSLCTYCNTREEGVSYRSISVMNNVSFKLNPK